jgi:hypothetical protein
LASYGETSRSEEKSKKQIREMKKDIKEILNMFKQQPIAINIWHIKRPGVF